MAAGSQPGHLEFRQPNLFLFVIDFGWIFTPENKTP
jgi:hypothetical protein